MDRLDEVIMRLGADAYVAFGSSRNADIRYLTKFRTEDPFIYIKKPGERGIMVIGQMEYDRATRESIASVMTRGESGLLDVLKTEPDRLMAYARVIANLSGTKILVPPSFPYGLGTKLGSLCEILLDTGSVESLREVKSREEISMIKKVQGATDAAMGAAVHMIKASKPKKGLLYDRSRPLTSEAVRAEMHKTLMDYGCHATDTIVSCGKDTALPHVLGTGQLLESEPIVIDIFPTGDLEGYVTDMTRTVVKGEPTQELRDMYDAVKDAQDLGMSLVKPGVSGATVHKAVVDVFEERGYHSNSSGFTHNLGHGVGLEVHEGPTLGPAGGDLVIGNVVTVEPGLYYREIGGIRLENTGAVTRAGFDSFTSYPREFILE